MKSAELPPQPKGVLLMHDYHPFNAKYLPSPPHP